MFSQEVMSNSVNVVILEKKLDHLEKQMNDLKTYVIKEERKVAEEKRIKLDSKFKQKFKQQKLPAWQPILTADTVLPAFFLIGLLFIPLGVALLYFSNNVQEKVIDYTQCKSVNSSPTGQPCEDVLEKELHSPQPVQPQQSCICEIEFSLDTTFKKNVYLYYGLENFYQNHRRYVKSRDDSQLFGKKITSVDNNCAPFDAEGEEIYAPCGAIANSLFNDSLSVSLKGNNDNPISVLKTGIAWPSDKRKKFKNPQGSLDPASNDFAFENTIKPKYWTNPVYELDINNSDNNGYQNEDLIVWMRTAAFPSFRKLYGRVDHSQEGFKNGMHQGNYTLRIRYNYPVKSFGGSKYFIISTTSFLGGKNDFLGIAYISVGSICLLLGVMFLIIHIKFGKRPADLQNITQNTPFSD